MSRQPLTPAELLEHAAAACRTHERSDLLSRLEHTRRRLADPEVRVLVVGEYKQGKSQLVNALVNAPVCPVDDDVATAIPTDVSYGDPPSAHVLLAPDELTEEAPVPEVREVAIDALTSYVLQHRSRVDGQRVVGARARLPRALLREGLVLVDTPGVGGRAATHSAATLAALPTADAVLLVTDASSEFTAPELAFLRDAMAACPTVAVVLSKTDLHPAWRRVRELDVAHLDEAGISVPVIPVSSTLRLAAARHRDARVNAESGFPELIAHLHHRVLARRDELLAESTAHDVRAVAAGLRAALTAELAALEDPSSLPELVSGLNAAKERVAELKRRSSRWQTTLADGMADLNADLDHDLRDRLRIVVREAEDAIDAGDPAERWDDFAQWFEHRVSRGLEDTFLWADRNAMWLLEQVGQHFAEDAQSAAPQLRLRDTTGLIDPVHALGTVDSGHLNLVQKVLIGMRGSYGGILMFGLLTGLAGMALVNPISIGAGLLLGTKAYREDAETRLKRRRAEAKQLVKKYADDVVFYVGKQLRDRLRGVQRTVREHYTLVADGMASGIAETLASAKRNEEATAAERRARLVVVRRSLDELDELDALTDRLVARPST
ncbi:isoniazid-induced dynamin-like GTPase IniA [Fodinibacter luteus]|uniref:Isoniazid-induced dynamin-like GTPase IniA n=1 Tax=Fodinibacter luteus TaxID=552064 RepID=A0ABP8KBR4_9MICO